MTHSKRKSSDHGLDSFKPDPDRKKDERRTASVGLVFMFLGVVLIGVGYAQESLLKAKGSLDAGGVTRAVNIARVNLGGMKR